MNKQNLLRKAGGLILAVLLLPGIAMLSGSTAQAQRRGGGFHGGFHGGGRVVIAPRIGIGRGWGGWGPRYYGWGPYPYYRNGYSQYVCANTAAAESQGYHDGLKTGSEDTAKGKSFEPKRSNYFQDAGFGNFADAYRQGFPGRLQRRVRSYGV